MSQILSTIRQLTNKLLPRSTSSPMPFLAADFCLGSDESHAEIDISENGATKRRYLQHLNGWEWSSHLWLVPQIWRFEAKTRGDLYLSVELEVHQPYLQPNLPKNWSVHAQIKWWLFRPANPKPAPISQTPSVCHSSCLTSSMCVKFQSLTLNSGCPNQPREQCFS